MVGLEADASLGRRKDLSRSAWVGGETNELVRSFFLDRMQARDSCIRNPRVQQVCAEGKSCPGI